MDWLGYGFWYQFYFWLRYFYLVKGIALLCHLLLDYFLLLQNFLNLLHRAHLEDAASNVLSYTDNNLDVALLIFLCFNVNVHFVKVLVNASPGELDATQLGKHGTG